MLMGSSELATVERLARKGGQGLRAVPGTLSIPGIPGPQPSPPLPLLPLKPPLQGPLPSRSRRHTAGPCRQNPGPVSSGKCQGPGVLGLSAAAWRGRLPSPWWGTQGSGQEDGGFWFPCRPSPGETTPKSLRPVLANVTRPVPDRQPADARWRSGEH